MNAAAAAEPRTSSRPGRTTRPAPNDPGGLLTALRVAGNTLTGNVYRVSLDGASVTAFVGGFQQTRGLAYDPAHRRLFVADHDATTSDGATHRLWILSVD